MPSPLRNMTSLAAAATECRLKGTGKIFRKINTNKEHKCFVRMQGDLIVRYRVRTVGGPELPALVHEDVPQRFEQSFELYDPDTFFRSYSACRDAIHQMLMHIPLLGEFDLGADNWDHFMPHSLASMNVDSCRQDTQKLGGVAHRYDIDMTLTVWADVLYDEPKALFFACVRQAASTIPVAECCVCMEDLAAQETVSLPCSHSFHRDCILPWFYKAATCPICRRDISKSLVGVTSTPKGKFPGLGV